MKQGSSHDRFSTLPKSSALSIFLTAGYPRLHDTVPLIERLCSSGVDMIEIGFPFSDPVADGPTIQESNRIAIENGMSVPVLFEQLREVRARVDIPLLLMGYLNPVEQYGVERFLRDAAECGIDGAIIPDMPFELYVSKYKPLFEHYGVRPVFLATPRTPVERLRAFDQENPAFLYLLSIDGVTGGSVTVSSSREEFFERVAQMGLASPLFVGFGVRDRESFTRVTKHTTGAIIGSAFLEVLANMPAHSKDPTRSDESSMTVIERYVKSVR